jgi:gas vesicle protein
MAKTYSKIILAGLAGLAAGLAVGVLVAPAKGTKTRKRLKKKFRKMEEILQQSGLSDKFNDLKSIFSKGKEENAEDEPPEEKKDQANS